MVTWRRCHRKRSAVQSVDIDLPVIDVRTQTDQNQREHSARAIFAAVTAGFGVLAPSSPVLASTHHGPAPSGAA